MIKSNTSNMEPRIELLSEKKLVGKHLRMNFANNQTFLLWKDLMPKRKDIHNAINRDLISMEVYDTPFNFQQFDPQAFFDKWAAVEVTDLDQVPEGLETFIIPGGSYAVFTHYGPQKEGERTYRYIFGTWLPNSGYTLDQRPHFAVMGEKYKPDSADSEEEIWIPVNKI
jgi:AraC family transcriptional regulator